MNELYCPKCGKKHFSANKHCQYCGENLEIIILKLKQKHLPIKYRKTPQDEEKTKEIEKNITDYVKAEEELNKYDILPENLTEQPISSTYTQSMHVQTLSKLPSQSQRIKLQRKEEHWWIRYFICCDC